LSPKKKRKTKLSSDLFHLNNEDEKNINKSSKRSLEKVIETKTPNAQGHHHHFPDAPAISEITKEEAL